MMRLTRDDVLKTKIGRKDGNTAFFPDTGQEGKRTTSLGLPCYRGGKKKASSTGWEQICCAIIERN